MRPIYAIHMRMDIMINLFQNRVYIILKFLSILLYALSLRFNDMEEKLLFVYLCYFVCEGDNHIRGSVTLSILSKILNPVFKFASNLFDKTTLF